MTEHFETCSKKGRGMAQRSAELIAAMYLAAEAAHPITGRGIGYKLFTLGLIPSMAKPEMQRVYRLLKEARELSLIPWEWIVDETRDVERVSTWADPEAYARTVARSYRRDFWNQQPVRCEVWSETVLDGEIVGPISFSDFWNGSRRHSDNKDKVGPARKAFEALSEEERQEISALLDRDGEIDLGGEWTPS